MKKLVMYSMSVVLIAFFTTTNAMDMKKTGMNAEKSITRKESKNEKKEIRKEEGKMISDMSKDAFIGDFGKISGVVWEKDMNYDVALFNKDGKDYKAFYDETSKLLGTVTDKTFSDLPKSAQKSINKEYKDYTIDKVIFFEDNEFNESDMLLYGTQFSDADNYFVELSGKNRNIVIQVNPEGYIFFFKELNKKV